MTSAEQLQVTPSQLSLARRADHIFISELIAEGIYREIGQAFAAILPVRAVGVVGDKRSYGQMVTLRAVESSDFMVRILYDCRLLNWVTDGKQTADWYYPTKSFLKRVSLRITNEIEGISRVNYDCKGPLACRVKPERRLSDLHVTVTSKPPGTIELE